MKQRSLASQTTPEAGELDLCRALLALDSVPAMRAFLHDLCTPAELEALIDRWQVVPYILAGMPYRDIHAHTAVSITTIGRVARFINAGDGGYLKAVASRRGKRAARKGLVRR